MVTLPSSVTLTFAPVASMMLFIVLPPGPIRSLILSCFIEKARTFGAYRETDSLEADIVESIFARTYERASFALPRAFLIISMLSPETFMSICRAVIPFSVPATLKSISPI